MIQGENISLKENWRHLGKDTLELQASERTQIEHNKKIEKLKQNDKKIDQARERWKKG